MPISSLFTLVLLAVSMRSGLARAPSHCPNILLGLKAFNLPTMTKIASTLKLTKQLGDKTVVSDQSIWSSGAGEG